MRAAARSGAWPRPLSATASTLTGTVRRTRPGTSTPSTATSTRRCCSSGGGCARAWTAKSSSRSARRSSASARRPWKLWARAGRARGTRRGPWRPLTGEAAMPSLLGRTRAWCGAWPWTWTRTQATTARPLRPLWRLRWSASSPPPPSRRVWRAGAGATSTSSWRGGSRRSTGAASPWRPWRSVTGASSARTLRSRPRATCATRAARASSSLRGPGRSATWGRRLSTRWLTAATRHPPLCR
mmetsp:Transcript_2013/g.5629  ORF Transcript_2013/g.5629 Transcript_2013/m.5629 type:complete len:241 (-) Transcript_2013:610-1332(-)